MNNKDLNEMIRGVKNPPACKTVVSLTIKHTHSIRAAGGVPSAALIECVFFVVK